MIVCSLAQQKLAQESLHLPEMHSLTIDPDQAYSPVDEQYSPAGFMCDSEGKGRKGKLGMHLCLIPNGSNLMM